MKLVLIAVVVGFSILQSVKRCPFQLVDTNITQNNMTRADVVMRQSFLVNLSCMLTTRVASD